ncbi:hypothetical protein [Vibrio vulnificus YJ016]|uniref:Uncharacterized protein n=1 Tax=Vibrio vulnificus (strain YJ016) TaxID=196600 RepID=Q7MCN3_VIBVY|nr:hypothetical protein [Vibrio vulnificus YJ016]
MKHKTRPCAFKPMALTLTTHTHSLLPKLNGHIKRGTYIADK